MFLLRRATATLTRSGLSPMLATQSREHHFRVLGMGGEQTFEHLGPHTQEQAQNMGVTRNFANRHLAELEGESPTSDTQAKIAKTVANLRSTGVGVEGGNPTPRYSTTIMTTGGFVPPVDNVVKTGSPGVSGIVTTDRKSGFSPSVNSTAEVGRNTHGQVNHLESSS